MVGAFTLLGFLVIQLVHKVIYLDNCKLRLMLEIDEVNTSYINAKLELDRITDDLISKINNISKDKHSDGGTSLSQTPVQSNSNFHLKGPGRFHRYMLVSDVTPDKLYIVSEKKRNDYKFIIGIPTIARPQKQKYLADTIKSLLKDSASIQQLNILIIIYVADIESNRCGEVLEMIRTSFDQFIRAGMIEILCPHATLYPSLEDLPQTLGDPVDRVKWRSKQNLDFAFLMAYAATKGDYYLQLEDDVIASDGYAYLFDKHVESVKDDNWFLIHFSSLGFIGKLMRCNDLIAFSQYLLLYYNNQPCDWLMNDYGKGLVCYSSLSTEQCNSNLEKIYTHYSPSLFQHMGTVSSLNGDINNLKDPLFKEEPDDPFKPPGYSNPPAKVVSNFSIHYQYTANKIYEGSDIFWSNAIHEGDDIIIEFNRPQKLKGLLVRSGNEKHPGDKMEHGMIQYKIEGTDQFEHWCDFKDGEANCSRSSSVLVTALRISASQPQAPWLLISHLECLL